MAGARRRRPGARPATSANLGPGFDALGLSLGLYDDVVPGADSGLHIDIAVRARAPQLARRGHLLVRSLRTAFDLLGGQPRGLEMRLRQPHPARPRPRLLLRRHLRRHRRRPRRDHRRRGRRLDDAGAAGARHRDRGTPRQRRGLSARRVHARLDGRPAPPRAIRMEPADSIVPVVFVPGTAGRHRDRARSAPAHRPACGRRRQRRPCRPARRGPDQAARAAAAPPPRTGSTRIPRAGDAGERGTGRPAARRRRPRGRSPARGPRSSRWRPGCDRIRSRQKWVRAGHQPLDLDPAGASVRFPRLADASSTFRE